MAFADRLGRKDKILVHVFKIDTLIILTYLDRKIYTFSASESNFIFMSATLKALRAFPTRRGCASSRCWSASELSVNELQEITRMGQSRISTHLGLLQESGLLESRREGKRTFYKLWRSGDPTRRIHPTGRARRQGIAGTRGDQLNLKRILVAAPNRRSFISTRSPAGLTAVTARAVPGRLSGNLLLRDCCRRWSSRIWARAKDC
jgi:DNA-binding transcriptional ArsR family regulator